MPIDASIPLQVESPIKTLGGILSNQNLQSEIGLHQAQTQHALQQANEQKAIAEQRAADLADERLVQQHFASDPNNVRKFYASGGDLSASPLAGMVQPKTLLALSQHASQAAQGYQKARTDKVAADQAAIGAATKSLQSIYEIGQQDPSQIPTLYQRALQNNPAIKDLPFQPPPTLNNLDEVKRALVEMGAYTGVMDHTIEQQKKQADLAATLTGTEAKKTEMAHTAAQTQQTQAATAEVTLKARQLERQQVAAQLSAAAQQGPAALQAAVSQLAPEHQSLFSGVTNPKAILRLAMSPDEITKSDMAEAELARQNRAQASTEQHQRALEGYEAQKVGIEGQRLNLQRQQAGFEQNGGISENAKAIASGTVDPATARAMLRKSPGLLGQIRQADPNFDEAQLEKRFGTLKEFNNTSVGKAGGQALALNTMIHHADLYMEAAQALKNGSFKPGNAAYNAISTMMGGPAPNNAALVANFLAGETAKVATGGVPGEHEIQRSIAPLATNGSPKQMEDAAKQMLGIAAGRATPLIEKVKDAKLENVVHVLGPDAQTILAKHGFDPATMKPMAPLPAPPPGSSAPAGKIAVKAPNGNSYYFSDQAAADNFKQAAGIK
jgi:hypothetical protein